MCGCESTTQGAAEQSGVKWWYETASNMNIPTTALTNRSCKHVLVGQNLTGKVLCRCGATCHRNTLRLPNLTDWSMQQQIRPLRDIDGGQGLHPNKRNLRRGYKPTFQLGAWQYSCTGAARLIRKFTRFRKSSRRTPRGFISHDLISVWNIKLMPSVQHLISTVKSPSPESGPLWKILISGGSLVNKVIIWNQKCRCDNCQPFCI